MVNLKNTTLLLLTFTLSYCEYKTSASSILNNKKNYSHENCIDGNYNTAWVEGNSSNGTGEWIKVDFSSEKKLFYLGILPGFLKYSQEGKDLWSANNSIAKATLCLSDNTQKTLFFSGLKEIEYFKIDKKTSYVKITIDSVFNGTKYNDACISEIIPIFEPDHEPDHEHDRGHDVLIKYLNYFSIYPFTIHFKTVMPYTCDKINNPINVLNDTTYYFSSDYFAVDSGTKFILTSAITNSVEVFQRSEYRWAAGGSDSDGPSFYDWGSIVSNSASHFTDWLKIKPVNGLYELIKIAEPGTIKDYKIQPVISEDIVISYFDSLNIKDLYFTYTNNRSKRMALLKFSTQVKIKYEENGKTKNIYLIFLNMYGEC